MSDEGNAAMPSGAVRLFESDDYRVVLWAGFIEFQDLNANDVVAVEGPEAVKMAAAIVSRCSEILDSGMRSLDWYKPFNDEQLQELWRLALESHDLPQAREVAREIGRRKQ